LKKHSNKFFAAVIALTGVSSIAPAQQKAKADKRPNILFCISDDQSFPHAGAYGCKWVKTPAFDRVAREGILFTNAYTPNAKSAPSRSCIITGRNSWQLEAAANHWPYFPSKFKTYSEVLVENGYHLGHTAKGWAPGIVEKRDGNDRQLVGPTYNKYTTQAPTSEINRNDYAANFRDFLENNTDDKPFCFWFGCTEPHRAYEFRSGVKKGEKKLTDINEVLKFWPDNDSIRHDMLDYAYEIEHFDEHLGRMLQILEENGLLENTLIVVTSDNGMPFPRVKGHEYEYSTHLPLAMMWKKGINNPGRKVDGFVSFTDFAPTFLELAGINPHKSGMQPFEGTSLSPVFDNRANGRNFMVIGKERTDVGRPDDQGYPIRGIVENGYMYLRNFEPSRWPAGNPETGYLDTDGSPTKSFILNHRRLNGKSQFWDWNFGKRSTEELYQIVTDPYCINNLADLPEHASLKKQLESKLVAELKQEGDPRMFGKGNVFDKYPYSDKNSVNFYNRFRKGEKLNSGWVEDTDFEKEVVD